MFPNLFTCPVMGPLEQGWAELAALPLSQWEEAHTCGSKQLPGFGSEQRGCDGIWTCQGATLPPTPTASRGAGSSCAAVSVMRGDGLHWCGGGWQSCGGGQAGPLLCCVLGAAGAQRAPQLAAALGREALMSLRYSVPIRDVSPGTYPEGVLMVRRSPRESLPASFL